MYLSKLKIMAGLAGILFAGCIAAEVNKPAEKAESVQSVQVATASLYRFDLDPEKISMVSSRGIQEKYFNRFTGAYEVAAASEQAAHCTKRAGENGSLYLDVTGNVGSTHGAEWCTLLTAPTDFKTYGYFYATVRASGLRRKQSPQAAITATGEKKVVLLNTAEIVQDGAYRTYWKKVRLDAPVDGIQFSISTKNTTALLEVAEMGFARDLKDIPQHQYCAGKFSESFLPVAIDPARFNWSLQANLNERLIEQDGRWAVTDAVRNFTASNILVNNIPFAVSTNEQSNLIRPENKAQQLRGETVTVLGRELNRNSYQPLSRKDSIFVDVNNSGSELYFLLSSTLPSASELYALPPEPRRVNFIDAFQVKLHYSDGTTDMAFPFQLKAEGFQLSGFFGAYMVPLNAEKCLKQVEFVNKIARYDFALAAVTLNRSAVRRCPQAVPQLAAQHIPAEKSIAAVPCEIIRNGSMVSLENSYYKLELDFSKGFVVKSLLNKFTGEQVAIAPGSGVLIKQGTLAVSGTICQVQDLQIKDNKVTFMLDCGEYIPAKFQMAISVDQTAQIKFHAAMILTEDKAKIEFCFPYFYNFKQGELADNGYFYPQYRNVLTTRNSWCQQLNNRSFTMQFFDLFNQKSGGGLLFMTDNSSQMPTWYVAGKSDSGMTGYIANKSEELEIKVNTPLELCPRSITVHGGAWSRGVELYRDWVNSWYKPVNAQDKEKFLNAFYIHVTASAPCDAGLWPFLIDQKSKKYDVNAYLAAVSKQFNRKPDIFHFYWWSYRPQGARNGEYGDKDFQTLIGGREKFRKLIDELQAEDMLVSLYTIWDRYDRDTEFFAKYGEKMIIKRADGTSDKTEHTIYTGVGGEARRCYAAKALKRLVESVDNDIVYMDVFGTDWYEQCINPECGHRVPSYVAEDDGLFLQQIREALPDRAIWSEYPVTDLNARYMDGNINYFALPLSAHIASVYDRDDTAPRSALDMLVPDAYRFSFPRLKQVVFQVGQEGFIETWAYMKFNLFNGYALYDTTFWLYFEETRLNLAKTLDIQHEYKDCFLSEKPEMLVPTLVNGVYANCFPGKGRTLWTFYNGNYTTLEMPVIAVEHQEGDTYFDLWDNVQLKPEIKDGKAFITLRLDPQAVGCIVRKRP